MQVPFIDLKPQYMNLRAEIHSAIERVMASQAYILGDDEQTLSKEVAEYSQTKYGIACASGSDALLLALMALEIGAGDEVITTSYSFFATAGAIARLGARPRFVDIELKTYNIDVSKIEESINEHTRAIMPVHLFGQCTDMDAILEVSERYELPVIEDAAQAIGATDKGRRAGSLGDIGCFSFYPTKNLGGAGDGGCSLPLRKVWLSACAFYVCMAPSLNIITNWLVLTADSIRYKQQYFVRSYLT